MIPILVFTQDIIKSIVASMISSGTIDSISSVDNVYTILCSDTGNLKDYFKVKIGDDYYRVSDLSENKSFKITTTTNISAEVEWAMYINYYPGSLVEYSEYIQRKTVLNKHLEKFDSIWLMAEDIPENYLNDNISSIYKTAEITMAIVTNTNKEKTTAERLDDNFKTKIEPLFKLFCEKMFSNSSLIFPMDEPTNIDAHNRFIYGSEEHANILNEITDAKEFKTIIKIKKQYLKTC